MRKLFYGLLALGLSTTPAHNFTLLTVRDAPYNAVGDGVTDDAPAFQRMIDDACPGHARTAAVNQLFPVIVPYSTAGTGTHRYMIGSGINYTNCLGLWMGGLGSGMTYPVIQQIQGTVIRNLIDMTGSVSGCRLSNIGIYGPLGDGFPNPETAILMAQSDITPNSGNFCDLDKVQWSGRFTKAGLGTFGVCCSLMKNSGGTNAIMSSPNAYTWALTSNNVMGFSSAFANIIDDGNAHGASTWSCNRCEMHAFTGQETVSPKAILLEGTRGFLYSGGNAAAANGYIIETKGTNSGITLDTVTFYTDQGPKPGAVIGGVAGTLSNLVMTNMDATLATGGVPVSVGGYNGTMINGVLNAGGVVINYNACGMGTAPAISGCHVP